MNKTFAIAEVKAVDTADPNGEFEAILSAPTLDRDGEVIDGKAFSKDGKLPDSIPVHAFHDFNDPIGRGVPEYRGDVLYLTGRFASTPRAQEIRTLVTEGVMTSMSVGFMAAKKNVKDGVAHITEAELLEGSFVSIPSNREAAVLAAKEFESKVGARNSAADSEHIQAAHDHMAALGASCGDASKAFRKFEAKTAVDGSYEERQEELREAIAAANADALHPQDGYAYLQIVATFDDHVVYCIWQDDNDDSTFSVTYTWDGDEVTLGTPVPVEVTEVVTVSDETASATRSAPTPGTDAKGADEENADLELRARVLGLLAAAAAD